MNFLERVVPAPLLSATLVALWLLLARSTSLGQVLLGLGLGLAVPLLSTQLRLSKVRVRRPLAAARFLMVVGRDVLWSNVEVAWSIVAWRWRRPHAAFVVIPLELRDPVALAVLSMVTTVVPGTVWSELARDRSALMLHVWNIIDEDRFVARFKARYETPLREIFE